MLDELSERKSHFSVLESSDPLDYEKSGLYFHGTEPVENVESILDQEAIVSYARNSDPLSPATPVIEDLLRIDDIGYDHRDLNLVNAIEEYREKLEEEGTEETREILNDPVEMEFLEELTDFKAAGLELYGRTSGTWRKNSVSVGHVNTDQPFIYGEEGAVFEMILPESAVHQNQEVPGYIPLDFAEAMYIGPEVSKKNREKLTNNPSIHEYNLDIRQYSDFDY